MKKFAGAIVPQEWTHWAGVSLLSGVPLAEVISTMQANDIDEAAAAAACASVFVNPGFDVVQTVAQQHRKLVSMLQVRAGLLDLDEGSREIPRRGRMSKKLFLRSHYARNEPVVLTDVCHTWPALSRWSPDYLIGVLGPVEVEVMTNRDTDADYELNADLHRETVAFADYAAAVASGDSRNNTYIVANNQALQSAAAQPLWDDIVLDKRYMTRDTGAAHASTYLWFGSAGTVTKLHHDAMNVMFHQVVGTKRFTLLSPLDTLFLYNNVSVYSDVDPMSPDLDRFPSYAYAHPVQVTVGPGEAIFVPAGWWHHVEALELSISVSSTAFDFRNEFEWFFPERVEPR